MTIDVDYLMMPQQEMGGEIGLLFEIAGQINAATTYDEVIAAVRTSQPDADGILLNFFENLDYRRATYIEAMAIHARTETARQGLKPRIPVPPVIERFIGERLWVVEDVYKDPRFDEQSLALYSTLPTKAVLIIPLQTADRLWGVLVFNYDETRTFSERERHLMMGIGNLVVAATERIRSQIELKRANEEAAFMYQLAADINAATTYDEIIRAVRPSQPDADGVILDFFEHFDYRIATYIETVAIFTNETASPQQIPVRMPVPPVIEELVGERLWISENIYEDPRFDAHSLAVYRHLPTQALLIIPLHTSDRIWGALVFSYCNPRTFTEHDQRLMLGIGDLVIAAVERIHSQLEMRLAKDESSFLYELAESINAANTYQDITDAVARLMPDCDGVYLNLWENLDIEKASHSIILAGSNIAEAAPDIIGRKMMRKNWPIDQLIYRDRITVIEDIETDLRVDPLSLESWREIGTAALLWLMFIRDDRNIGFLFFNYLHPHRFSERDRRIALGIGDLALAATLRVRSQIEVNEANQEAAFMYKLAENINAATTYHEIVDAISQLMPDCDGVYLKLWEHLDFERASYIEVVAGANVPPQFRWIIGHRMPRSAWPQMPSLRREKLTVIEDTTLDARIDDAARHMWVNTGVRALVAFTFLKDGKNLGSLIFNYMRPRMFSSREQRIALGIGDLALAAVERIRLQMLTSAAHERAVTAAAINAALLHATEESLILSAVADTIGMQNACEIRLYYSANVLVTDHTDFSPVSRWDFESETPYQAFDKNNGQIEPDAISALQNFLIGDPETIVYVENVETDTRISESMRASLIDGYQVRAFVLIGLLSSGRWQGNLMILWGAAHNFSEQEKDIYTLLKQNLSSVVATRRAYVAEQGSRSENELLYTASKAVNQATTVDDILRAVKICFPNLLEVAIIVWENYDRDGARYAEVIASSFVYTPRGTRWDRESVPELAMLKTGEIDVSSNIALHDDLGPSVARESGRRQLRCVASANMQQDQRVIGVLSIASALRADFTASELRLMSALTDLTAAAIERQRLQERTERARRQAETLAQISTAAATLREEQQLLRTFISLMEANFAPHQVNIYLNMNDDSFVLWPKAIDDPSVPKRVLTSESLSVIIAAQNEDVTIGVEADSAGEPCTVIAVPMVVNNQVIGVIHLRTPLTYVLRESEKQVMFTMADLIAVAVQNARYFDKAQELAALEERTRLARELHDSVSQALYGIGLGAQAARRSLDSDPHLVRESVEYVLALAEAGLTEMRALIFELRPESLETEGLVVALAKQSASMHARHGVDVRLELCDEPTLSLANKESLYRVAREALHNVVKHASASQVILRMVNESGMLLRLEVIDNGIGFDMNREYPGHLGLHSMQERVNKLGGQFLIHSAPGNGTHLTVLLPL